MDIYIIMLVFKIPSNNPITIIIGMWVTVFIESLSNKCDGGTSMRHEQIYKWYTCTRYT